MKPGLAALISAALAAGCVGSAGRLGEAVSVPASARDGARIETASSHARVGSDQVVRLSGLVRGETVEVSWFDADGRQRGRWERTASRSGKASVRFNLRHAAPGTQRIVAARRSGRSDALISTFTLQPEGVAGRVARPLDGLPPYLRMDPDFTRARMAVRGAAAGERILARAPCLSDRALRDAFYARLAPVLRGKAAENPALRSLGRGVGIVSDKGPDYCRSTSCVQGFARYLHRRYTDVENMAALWREQAATFADAEPAATGEVVAALAATNAVIDERLAGRIVSWSDHRRHMDSVWLNALAGLRALVREAGSDALVGLESVRMPSIFGGAEPARLLSLLDWVSFEPDELHFALARAFSRRGAVFLVDADPSAKAGGAERGALFGAAGAIAPDGSVTPASDILPGGVAELLRLSTWEADPVLVLYSQRSVELEWLVSRSRGGDGAPGEAVRAWLELLADIGISPGLVSSRHVLSRALAGSGAKALILPRATVLSEGELTEIARFERAGGLVVADSGAGLFDERMSARLRSKADRLFGIERDAAACVHAIAEAAALSMKPAVASDAFTHGVSAEGLITAESGVRAVSGFALGGGDGVDALIRRRNAVYLNLDVGTYRAARGEAGGENMRRLVANVLELAQVEPCVEVVSGGRPLPGCSRLARRLEETVVHAVWLDPSVFASRVEAELVFAEPGYVFDSLRGVLLGRGGRVTVRLDPGANVFSWAPYDVTGLSIRARVRGRAVRYEAMIETTTGSAGTHLVRQTVIGPEGDELAGASRAIVAGRGVARGGHVFALDDPPGRYHLVLRDAATGVEGQITIVREAESGRP